MPVTMTSTAPISDEHSVLLWQTCAYADELTDAVAAGRGLTPVHDAMLEFLHYGLLPYLRDEERQISGARLRDDHMLRLLVSDHDRMRALVDNIEFSRTRRLLVLGAEALVDRLERHVRREESWVSDPLDTYVPLNLQTWALPRLLGDVIDLDALPTEHRDALLRQRLLWMRPGETVHLEAGSDLQPVWRRQHAYDHSSHAWAYEEDGPDHWRARVTRRPADQE